MDNLVKVCMSVLQGKKEIVIGSKVSQAEFDALSEICIREDRSMSYVLRELAIRGLALYKQDGQLKITAQEERIIAISSAHKTADSDVIEIDNQPLFRRESGSVKNGRKTVVQGMRFTKEKEPIPQLRPKESGDRKSQE